MFYIFQYKEIWIVVCPYCIYVTCLIVVHMCSLKLSLSSVWTPRSCTDEFDLIFSFPISTYTFLLLDLPLSRRITWNLSGFTIILLLWSQFIAVSHSDCKIVTSPLSVFAKLHRVLSSAKLWTDAFGIKKKKSLKKILNKIGPKIEPWGTPDIIVSNSLCLLFIWTHCLRSFK